MPLKSTKDYENVHAHDHFFLEPKFKLPAKFKQMKIGNRPEIYKDTKDNTVESNNKMIAEFMGLYAGDKQYWNPDRKGCGIIDFAKYHKDWNWLMPVIHKIEQYKFRDDQDDYAFMSTLHSGMCRINRFPLFEADTLIEAAYQSVVDFVKWYNDETN